VIPATRLTTKRGAHAPRFFALASVTPDLDLLRRVAIGLGPAIYNADASLVSGNDAAELDTVRNNFLIRKLGLNDGPELTSAIDGVLDTYGRSNRNKHRAVVYYLLTKHFARERIYA
jgi:hypothetical protein